MSKYIDSKMIDEGRILTFVKSQHLCVQIYLLSSSEIFQFIKDSCEEYIHMDRKLYRGIHGNYSPFHKT